jgi:hypothetical protein
MSACPARNYHAADAQFRLMFSYQVSLGTGAGLNLIVNQGGRGIAVLVCDPVYVAFLMDGLAVFIGTQIRP